MPTLGYKAKLMLNDYWALSKNVTLLPLQQIDVCVCVTYKYYFFVKYYQNHLKSKKKWSISGE
jgi:hypothetical protein